jgi:hypothetical protein
LDATFRSMPNVFNPEKGLRRKNHRMIQTGRLAVYFFLF